MFILLLSGVTSLVRLFLEFSTLQSDLQLLHQLFFFLFLSCFLFTFCDKIKIFFVRLSPHLRKLNVQKSILFESTRSLSVPCFKFRCASWLSLLNQFTVVNTVLFGGSRAEMALATTDCRRLQGHQLLVTVPLNVFNQSRLPFVAKHVGSYFSRRQESLRFNIGRVKKTGRLQRNSFPSISSVSELMSGQSMTRSISEFGLGTEVSSRGEQADEDHRPPFDLHLAVLLAGFAFESYNTPAETAGVLETDEHHCETSYLSRKFIKSIYDGQMFVNLRKGVHFPGLDLWGTSDPFVVLRIGHCSVRSSTIWVNKDPVWNEKLTINVKKSPGQNLQVAAWDANMVLSQRMMGATSVSLDSLWDGKPHSVELDLKGTGGGGRLFLEVQFKSFAQIEAEKNLFPFARSFGWELASKAGLGGIGITVGEFMGDFMSSVISVIDLFKPENGILENADTSASAKEESQLPQISQGRVSETELGTAPKTMVAQKGTSTKPKVGTSMEETSSATETNVGVFGKDSDPLPTPKELFEGLIKQTEVVVGAWAVSPKCQEESQSGGQVEPSEKEFGKPITTTTNSAEDEKQENIAEEILDRIKKAVFTTAESAMEAWALLATTLGGTSFVKSDFEKICFVENTDTDTQVALWRDLRRQIIVVAFRGTQQTKWRDVVTDLSLLAAGLNLEHVAGGNNHEHEPLVHSGFLEAYESVNTRILSLLQASMDSSDSRWHIYVTGHSLGGALATLCAYELLSTDFAKNHNFRVTMYNYGSPRVGNRVFADKYNEIIKDTWRVVNHRDIVPTVPRLMGYCHIAQPIYLTSDKSPVLNLFDDGYNGEVIGEATPGVIIKNFLRGEQIMLHKLLQSEIAMLRAVRDGSAFIQHMENFYYMTLLQCVESRNR